MATIVELYDRARHVHRSGNLEHAETLYQAILQADPGHADAHHLLGLLDYQTGRHDAALALIRRAIGLNPNVAAYHSNLALVLIAQEQMAEAVECCRRALRLNPPLPDALRGPGVPANVPATGEALECHVNIHNNLGICLTGLGELPEAVASLREALRLRPHFADALSNLGLALRFMGQLDEAAACFDQALRYNPAHLSAHANRAMFRLLRGNFKEGWPEFEFRWGQHGIMESHTDRPRWDGSPLPDTTILVYAEQGLGDTLQFIRYAPLVKERVGTVLFECQAPLKHLLKGIAGVDQVVAEGAPLPPFDVQTPLLSLPAIFGTTLATIPAVVPYLRADPERVAYWSKELNFLKGLRVGIAWQGKTSFKDDKYQYRSLPLAQFETLERLKGVQLVSLQVGIGTDQLRAVAGRFPLLDLSDRLDKTGAFIDTAAVLTNLDLLVTVDSAVAHVAGALGVPVWVALPFAPCWRWLAERADSPWYPTMRLFRQSRPGDWSAVFERIATELVSRVA